MNRYTVHAPQHVPKVSLNTYVHRAFPLLTDSAIRNAFQARDVKMNGMRCSKDQLIEPGAEVTVFTPCKMDIPIVCENEEIIALDKPAGVSCDADSYGSMTVQDWAVLNAKGSCQPRLCHRLDNATSGIVLLAKNEAVETALLDMFAEHRIQKTY